MKGGRQRRLGAVVVSLRNFGDAHRIVEVLTAEEGRVSAVAHNARGSRRRFAALDLFASAQLLVRPGGSLWQLDEAEVSRPRVGIRSSLECIERAACACKAVRLLVAEHAAAPEVFSALEAALDELDQGRLALAARFYPRLLTATGIMPDVARCSGCGRRDITMAWLDGHAGGAFCRACAPAGKHLPPGVVAGLLGQDCPDEATASALESCALAWIEAQAGRPLRGSGWAAAASPVEPR
jgi:DNA repair protein RecO (recombination protein O)